MFFGQHSMNMWLTHTLFIYYYMKKITFITENSIVMYLTVIGCSLTVSILVGKIKKHTGVLNKRSIPIYHLNSEGITTFNNLCSLGNRIIASKFKMVIWQEEDRV